MEDTEEPFEDNYYPSLPPGRALFSGDKRASTAQISRLPAAHNVTVPHPGDPLQGPRMGINNPRVRGATGAVVFFLDSALRAEVWCVSDSGSLRDAFS